LDVARKALILARTLGFTGDVQDVAVDSLVPDELRTVSLTEFLDRLDELNAPWAARLERARADGKLLRYRARVTPTSVSVGLSAVAASDPLATLTGTDNQFAFTTARYREQPLVITGPGAGAAVTAGGVYNDVLRIVAEGRPPVTSSLRSKHSEARRVTVSRGGAQRDLRVLTGGAG
jgi:homoserine dehydrogenase